MVVLSIGKAWEEARAFITRERALLLPVSLLLIGVPFALLFQLIPPELRSLPQHAGGKLPPIPPANAFGMLLAAIMTIIGSLSLYSLALKPGISVAEALQIGVRKMPVCIAATLIMAFALSLPLLGIMLVAPALARVAILIAGAIISVRTLMLNPVLVEQPLGPVDALVASWRMTKGYFWRLSLFLLIVTVPIVLAQSVAQMLFGLVGLMIGGRAVAEDFIDIGGALVMAGAQILIVVMVARLYRQMTA